MSCDDCTSGKNMKRDKCSDVSIGEVDGVYRIFYSDGYRGGATEQIRFCPMCGEPFPYNPPDSLKSIKDDLALDVCTYAKKRGVGDGGRADDKRASCNHCEWWDDDRPCGSIMREDLVDRLGKLLDEEDKHER